MSTVAVRELCEFTAKRGDLDLRFTPAPTAQEGIAGHGVVSRRRGEGYEREIALESRHGALRLRGRADGLRADPLVLEEIKTYRGELSRMPENHRALHWAQLKLYGAQLCAQRQLASIGLALIYFDVDSQQETALAEEHSAEALQRFHDEHCGSYLQWELRQQAHRQARDAALHALKFPHAEFHAGQRRLAEAVYRAAARGEGLMAQAPTGIGKSIGTLFPALKALAANKLDKIFFLTAKTSGRQAALDALDSLSLQDPLPLRVLELVARDKACEHPDKACHGASCPLARGFYDRLPAAREAAVQLHQLDQASVRSVAARHQVCPYYLAQDLVRWADVVVGDYNYYYDRSALLHGLTLVNDWKVAVLVDEAHNLVERGRAMYSAELAQPAVQALRPLLPAPARRRLTALVRAWNRFNAGQERPYACLTTLPSELLEPLRKLAAAIGEHLAEHPAALLPELQRGYFDLLGFIALADEFGSHSLFDAQRLAGARRPASVIGIRNVVPARFLAPRMLAATSTVVFSATLNPPHFYRDLLGLPAATRVLDVPTPFSAEQLEVRLVSGISTRYRRRAASLAPIADLIARQYRQQPGNYLAYFSSYDYLEQVTAALRERHPQLPLWPQGRRMREAERAQFLAQFTADSRGVGLAVLGGVFAEGIDLPGQRLIGVFVATLGLPQVNPFNEEVMRRMGEAFGPETAYEYTYLYPGLQKVVQAAGRVLRSRSDRGTVHLIDDRYVQPAVRSLLPAWWQPRREPA